MNIVELKKKEIAIITGGSSTTHATVEYAVFSCIFSYFYAPQPTVDSRIKTAMVAWGCIVVSPIIGVGLGNIIGNIVDKAVDVGSLIDTEAKYNIATGIFNFMNSLTP